MSSSTQISADQGYFTNTARDHLNSAGLLLGIIGLAVTIVAAKRALSAEKAAKKAADAVDSQDRSEFRRYSIANAHRLMKEAAIFIDAGNFKMVAIRLDDLADQIAQVGYSQDPEHSEWTQTATELRQWESTFRRIGQDEITYSHSVRSKWQAFRVRLLSRIDSGLGPFKKTNESVKDRNEAESRNTAADA